MIIFNMDDMVMNFEKLQRNNVIYSLGITNEEFKEWGAIHRKVAPRIGTNYCYMPVKMLTGGKEGLVIFLTWNHSNHRGEINNIKNNIIIGRMNDKEHVTSKNFHIGALYLELENLPRLWSNYNQIMTVLSMGLSFIPSHQDIQLINNCLKNLSFSYEVKEDNSELWLKYVPHKDMGSIKKMMRETFKDFEGNSVSKYDDPKDIISTSSLAALNFIYGFDETPQKAFPETTKILGMGKREYEYPNYLCTIIEVKDLPSNRRLAIYKIPYYVRTDNNRYYDHKPTFELTYAISFYIIDHENPMYNYTDPGVLFFTEDIKGRNKPHTYHYYYRNDIKLPHRQIGDVYWDPQDENPVYPNSVDLMMDFLRGRKTPVVVTNAEIKQLLRRHDIREMRRKKSEETKKKARTAWDKRLETLKKDTSKVISINNVKYTSDRAIYEGQTLWSDFDLINPPLIVKAALKSLNNVDDLNWDEYKERFLDTVVSKVDQRGKDVTGNLIIGSIEIEVKNVVKNTKNGLVLNYIYVNGKRINREDFKPVLNFAQCCVSDEQYASYIKSVSECSLKIHKYIEDGLRVLVKDHFLNSNVNLMFPIARRRGKNYININGERYPIRNINKLLTIQKKRHLEEVLSVLEDDKVVEIEFDHLGLTIEAGKTAYEDAVEKSENLLKYALDVLNAKKISENIGGTRKTGFLVDSGEGKFFVEEKTARVYIYPTGSYVCIVDKLGDGSGKKDEVGKDRIVNRLFALKNKSKVAGQVTTLQNT